MSGTFGLFCGCVGFHFIVLHVAVRQMKLFSDFFRQIVPKNTKETLFYYRQSVILADRMLGVYFLLSILLVFWSSKQFFWIPLVIFGVLLFKVFQVNQLTARFNLLLISLIICAWTCWYVICFGWGIGGQHTLIVLVVLVFFCLYEPPAFKIVYFLLILTLRIFLYQYTSVHARSSLLTAFRCF